MDAESNKRIIFIVGNSRSGTTMLGRILGNHPQIYTFGELHFFEHLVSDKEVKNDISWTHEKNVSLLRRLLTSSREGFFSSVKSNNYEKDISDVLKSCDSSNPVRVYEDFLRYEAIANGKVIPCEQTPRYLFSSRDIFRLFPEARIINLVRDPRDVLLSQKNKWRRRFLGAKNIPIMEAFRAWANYHPFTISRLWLSAIRAASLQEKNPHFMTVRFEDLVSFPEENVEKICKFVGIPFQCDMLDVPHVGSSTGKDKHEKLGVDSARSGGWMNGGLSDLEIEVCESVVKEEMIKYGYIPEKHGVNFTSLIVCFFSLFIKTPLTLLLNIKRSRNICNSIKKRFFIRGNTT